MNFIISYLMNPKNIIKIAISVIILSLLIYIKVLSYKVEERDKKINILNGNIIELKSYITTLNNEITKQNNSIKELNSSFENRKKEFENKLKDLSVKNQPKIKYIEKLNNYQSPSNMTEIEASHKVIEDYLKFRKENK